jgi:hypothetical protein
MTDCIPPDVNIGDQREIDRCLRKGLLRTHIVFFAESSAGKRLTTPKKIIKMAYFIEIGVVMRDYCTLVLSGKWTSWANPSQCVGGAICRLRSGILGDSGTEEYCRLIGNNEQIR